MESPVDGMPDNLSVNTDALRRPAAARLTFASRRLPSRCTARGTGATKRGTSGFVGGSETVVAVTCSRASVSEGPRCAGEVVRHSTRASHRSSPSAQTRACVVGAQPSERLRGPDALSLAAAIGAMNAAGAREIGALNATARYNKAIDTDAQGRPRAARAMPIRGRRSFLRYLAHI